MKTIQFTIPKQTFKCGEEKAQLLEMLLLESEINYSTKILEENISESANSNIYTLEKYVNRRAFNVIKAFVEISPEIFTIKDFAEKYNWVDIRKARNCGKGTLIEIRTALHKFGFIYW